MKECIFYLQASYVVYLCFGTFSTKLVSARNRICAMFIVIDIN